MTAQPPHDNAASDEIAALRQRIADLEQQLLIQRTGTARLKLFEDLVDQATVGMLVADLEGRVQYLNPAAAALYGFEDQIEAFGRPLAELFVPEEEERTRAEILPALVSEGAWQGEVWGVRADGQRILVETSALMLTDHRGQPNVLALFIRDTTAPHEVALERQRLFDETRRQAGELRLFKALVDNAQDAVTFSSIEGTILYANAAFRTLSGFGDASVGVNFLSYYRPEEIERLTNEVQPALEREGRWQGLLQLLRPGGEQWLAQTSAFLLFDEEGKPLYQADILRDVTEQRRAEEERASLQQQVIAAQQAALRELSTPLIPLAQGVLVMPLIGNIDSLRAQQIVEALLQGVGKARATTVLLDITGVPIVDTHVAGALLQSAQAVRLLGAQIILTGIRPEVAQTLVGLGLDLSSITTLSSLQAGVAYALRGRLR